MGTRFLATPEANAHAEYKAKLVTASEEDTVRTILFGNGWPHAPHRALRTPFVSEWVGRENETQDSRLDEAQVGRTVIAGAEIPIQRFVSVPPNVHTTGDIESMALLAGQSVGLVNELRPAAEILRQTVDGAERLIRELSARSLKSLLKPRSSSPFCCFANASILTSCDRICPATGQLLARTGRHNHHLVEFESKITGEDL
jgi:NAD(P)H-dependent flavin oxidoreductase YrpB (nitropropane dioxygenase family)